jgi:hypothetical protein
MREIRKKNLRTGSGFGNWFEKMAEHFAAV